jgi:hypothetical protein
MLTDDLLQATCDALEHDAAQTDPDARHHLLSWTRTTLARWSSGSLTAEQAAARIRALQRAQGVVALRLRGPRPSTLTSPAA